jgi:hypothetical protein
MVSLVWEFRGEDWYAPWLLLSALVQRRSPIWVRHVFILIIKGYGMIGGTDALSTESFWWIHVFNYNLSSWRWTRTILRIIDSSGRDIVLRFDELGIDTKSERHLWICLREGDLSLEACGVSPSLAIVTQSAVAWSLELLKDIWHQMSNSGSLH